MSSRRRLLVVTAIFAGLTAAPAHAQVPLQPLRLNVVRSVGIGQTLGVADCVPGKLYVLGEGTASGPGGTEVSDTLELPWRWNKNDISSIPVGQYRGMVRTDGKLGWRIELQGTGARSHIQLHVGRRPANTIGCILVGTKKKTNDCNLTDPDAAIATLRDLFGENNSRAIEVAITE